MVAYLEQESSGASSSGASLLLEYLKSLGPPAVDLEIRALCAYEQDEKGVRLLLDWLRWLTEQVATRDSFEVLQAYLHRTLAIYSELVLKLPVLAQQLRLLTAASTSASDRFRGIIQKNLCLLKMMANIPVV